MIAAHGIPTTYKGVRFRSRLEARWACMFDLLAWPWDYEPLELAGYIPDFVLTFPKPVLVEVKPSLVELELRAHAGKIENSGWTNEALLLGARLFVTAPYGSTSLGLFGERAYEDDGHWWWEQSQMGWCGTHWGIAHCYGSYVCRVAGCYDGNPPTERVGDGGRTLESLWIEAGNRTQWRRR